MYSVYTHLLGGDSPTARFLVQHERSRSKEVAVCSIVIHVSPRWAAALRMDDGKEASAVWIMARNFGTKKAPAITVYETLETFPRNVFGLLQKRLLLHAEAWLESIRNPKAAHLLRAFIDKIKPNGTN